MASHPGVGTGRGTGGGSTALRAVGFVLLVGECLVILIPSIYGRATPELFGIPFFYWFQLLWIIVGMVVTGIVYLLFEGTGRDSRRAAPTASVPEPDGRGGAR